MNRRSGFLVIRCWHPTKDLAFLSSLLNMPCFRGWAVGLPRQTPLGEPLPGIYAESYWASQVEFPSEAGFNDKLMLAVGHLAKAEDTLHELKTSGGRLEIYLQLSGSVNHGATIASSLLKTMGELGLDLSIEIFPDA